MHKILQLLLSRFDRNAIQREVEEEFQFHIEMQSRDYERQGLTREASLAQARLRFGDFDQVKSQCVQIGSHNRIGTWILKGLFTISFLLGVLVRTLAPEFRPTRIGNVLIMIAVFGGLFVLGKSIRLSDFRRTSEPLRLGLNSSPDFIPIAFDEQGRTPFDRVRDE